MPQLAGFIVAELYWQRPEAGGGGGGSLPNDRKLYVTYKILEALL